MDSVKYIGMDVHKEAMSLAVLNSSGKLVMECIIETKASTILQFFEGLRRSLQVTLIRQQHLRKREHPPSTERISLSKECGWKDGDRGGLAEWEQTHGKKKAKCVLTSTGLLMEGLSSQATPNRAYARLEGINTVVTVIPY
jgi:hypothetical protein